MKLKLIQAGGFAGKPMIAEEDLSNYPAGLIQFIQTTFSNAKKIPGGKQPFQSPLHPDSFRYFVEFNDQRLPLESLENNIEFTRLVSKMKEQLHY